MKIENSEKLRGMAAALRGYGGPNAIIADGFDLIAGAMEPCVDCGAPQEVVDEAIKMLEQQHPEAFASLKAMAPQDNPETGA